MQTHPKKVALELAGEQVELYAERALYWPRQRMLLIADLHLGKADTFRRAGIAIPRGNTSQDLERLSFLLSETQAHQIWILGDVIHAQANPAPWRERLNEWRSSHPHVDLHALIGNHDRALINAELPVELHGNDAIFDNFLLRHHPIPDDSRHVICGHLHPIFALPSLPNRWPAFWLRKQLTILPAFTLFSGGITPQLETGDAIGVCINEQIGLIGGH